MRLASPYVLLALLVLPLLVYVSVRQQRLATIAYSSLHELRTMTPSLMTRLHHLLPAWRVLALILCIVALARPQQGLQASKIFSEGIAIVMVVDISGSMAALDMPLAGRQSNRLEAVKHTFRSFIQSGDGTKRREGDLVGMVTFARYADNVCPLTLDHDTLLTLLEQIEIVTQADEDGTAIGEGITLGLERLRSSTAKSRVMILLTDGVNNAGETEPQAAAQIAKSLGIKIYTIGAGTRGMAQIPVRTRDGRTVLQQTRVVIDEELLHEIATRTGGQYFRATDGGALQTIYEAIDRLEKTSNVIEYYQEYAERFPLFVLPALGLLVLEMVLRQTRFRTIP